MGRRAVERRRSYITPGSGGGRLALCGSRGQTERVLLRPPWRRLPSGDRGHSLAVAKTRASTPASDAWETTWTRGRGWYL
ncbi:hypothetical protein MRX96_014893 [Rhipicephalus microplus]